MRISYAQKILLRQVNIFFILFFGFSWFFYLLMNGGAYWKELRYNIYLHSPFVTTDLAEGEILEVPAEANIATAPVYTTPVLPQPATPTSTPVAPQPQQPQPQPQQPVVQAPKPQPATVTTAAGPQLVIGKIFVNAPIVTPDADSKQSILASLEDGVGLYPGSAPVGSVSGRSIILGHSSRASWYRGSYATVFALLPKIETGDRFEVVNGNKRHTYLVLERLVLSPADTNILLSKPVAGSEIDLVTCYPIGSASKRTIVRATLEKTEDI